MDIMCVYLLMAKLVQGKLIRWYEPSEYIDFYLIHHAIEGILHSIRCQLFSDWSKWGNKRDYWC